jgi:RNA polymerase sigma-70 factor (ECF subfamily)
MHQRQPLVDKRVLRPAQTALALEALSKIDLLRLKTVARIYARGLPEGLWEDMLQEALTRVFAGSRRRPEGVPVVAFVAGVLRSLRGHYWRRARKELRDDQFQIDHESDETFERDLIDPTPRAERALAARQQLALIKVLFSDDPVALTIIEGLADGLAAEEIRASMRLSKTDYDSARRRMRRRVLREGLTCEQN